MAETDVNVQLTGLKKDIENVTNLNARLDTAIEKLTDVSGDLKSMLAVHEEKISKTESADEQLADLIEVRRQEISNDIKELHTRINSQSKELREAIQTINDTLDKRVMPLERWRWVILGAFGLAAFLIGRMDDGGWFNF